MTNFNEYTDQALWDIFSDWYKDTNGFRPRGSYWTRERIVSWMESEVARANAQDELKHEQEEYQFIWEQWVQERELEHKRELEQFIAEQEELYQETREKMYYEMELALS